MDPYREPHPLESEQGGEEFTVNNTEPLNPLRNFVYKAAQK